MQNYKQRQRVDTQKSQYITQQIDDISSSSDETQNNSPLNQDPHSMKQQKKHFDITKRLDYSSDDDNKYPDLKLNKLDSNTPVYRYEIHFNDEQNFASLQLIKVESNIVQPDWATTTKVLSPSVQSQIPRKSEKTSVFVTLLDSQSRSNSLIQRGINTQKATKSRLRKYEQMQENIANIEKEEPQVDVSELFNFKSFEQYRNNTSYYDINKKWLEKVNLHYSKNKGRFVLQRHQFETVMYMSGQFMNGIHPRGLLLFHTMGTGKTMTNIASGFYCLNTLPNYTKKSKMVFICNKALSLQIQQEILKYIQILNKYSLDVNFQPQTQPLTASDFLERCVFITFNDSFSLDANLMKGFDSIQDSFVVFDEVHNLFKSVINDSDRGRQVYHYLLSKRLQIQFNSGTPFSSDLNEIGVCFNVLSGNPKLFPVQSVNSIFVQNSPESDDQLYIKNKEVLMRRLTGLVSAAEIEVDNEHYPKMNQLQIIQTEVSKEYRQIYLDTRKHNLKSQKFMSDSHLLDNAYIMSDDTIVSSKFEAIKAEMEKVPVPQLIYSQYVHKGSIIFTEYCMQQNTKKTKNYTWKPFSNSQQKRMPNEIVFALIHGQIESEERMKIISIFNSNENVNGDLITILCLSKASVEGINIKHIRKVHIMEAQWESRDLQQVISRGQRMHSHSLLPVSERNLTPFIYLTYTTDPKYAFNKDIHNMSTDQQIFFKQQSLVSFQNTLFTLLHFVSFNCHNLNQFTYMDQLFKPDFHKTCFTCESSNQQLFDPNFIHQDIVVNNCKRSKCKDVLLQFEYKNVEYGIYIDIYAPFGFWVFQTRDRFKKPIESEYKDFNSLIILAKSLIMSKYKETTQTQTQLEEDNNDFTIQTEVELFTIYDEKQKKMYDKLQLSQSKHLIHIIKPSSLTFNIGQFQQFQKKFRIGRSIHEQTLPKVQNPSQYSVNYSFYDIYSICSSDPFDEKLQSRLPQKIDMTKQFCESKPVFILNQITFNYNEFNRQIVQKFYIYLLTDIYMDLYQQLIIFFKKFSQLILFQETNKENQTLVYQLDVENIKYLCKNYYLSNL